MQNPGADLLPVGGGDCPPAGPSLSSSPVPGGETAAPPAGGAHEPGRCRCWTRQAEGRPQTLETKGSISPGAPFFQPQWFLDKSPPRRQGRAPSSSAFPSSLPNTRPDPGSTSGWPAGPAGLLASAHSPLWDLEHAGCRGVPCGRSPLWSRLGGPLQEVRPHTGCLPSNPPQGHRPVGPGDLPALEALREDLLSRGSGHAGGTCSQWGSRERWVQEGLNEEVPGDGSCC